MRPGVAPELLGFEWCEERAVDDFVFMRVTYLSPLDPAPNPSP